MRTRVVSAAVAVLAVTWFAQTVERVPSSGRIPSAATSLSRFITSGRRSSGGGFAFVSIPDFVNADLADVRRSPFWHHGDPNSIDRAYRLSISTILGDLRSMPGRDVLMAGDLVRGRWGRDDAGTGIFGPVNTTRHRVEAVRRAAATYDDAMRRRFRHHGLRLFPALGDHDIGNNPWDAAAGGWTSFKHAHVDVWKRAWARPFTDSGTRFRDRPVHTDAAGTAYAVRLTPDVLLVTVDEFLRTRQTVIERMGKGQLAWFVKTLAAARRRGTRWIIVQGHLPVLLPVVPDRPGSLHYQGGTSSPFWTAMRTYGVALYLCGEVHHTTAIVPGDGGPVQITHGGLITHGAASFLSGRVHGDELSLRTWKSSATRHHARPPLWQTDGRDLMYDWTYGSAPQATGGMVLSSDGHVEDRSGALAQPARR